MKTRRPTRLALAGLLVGLAAAPFGAAAAFAHDSLVQSDPVADATVTSLTKIDLTFNADPIDRDGADIIQVKGPDGKYYETGCPSLDGPVMSTPVAAGPAGTYEVLWRAVSSDGHPVASTFTFTYRPGAAASAASGSATPKCGPTSAATPGAAESSPSATTGSPNTGLWIGLGVGVAAIVVVGVGALLLIRRPRPTAGDGDGDGDRDRDRDRDDS